MKTKKHSPWLTPSGVEIGTAELREIAKSWDRETWEAYLNWYESPGQEKLVRPGVYKKICEHLIQSIFDQFGQRTNISNRERCEYFLKTLPPLEAEVLRLTFFDGRTQRQIGAALGLSQPGVYQARKRALARLIRGQRGEKVFTRQYMKGEVFFPELEERSVWRDPIWKSPPFRPAPSSERCNPKSCKETIANIQHRSLRLALSEMADDEQRMLYLQRWCGYSISETARELGMGVNLVEQITSAALSRLIRKIIHLETGREPGGGESCA